MIVCWYSRQIGSLGGLIGSRWGDRPVVAAVWITPGRLGARWCPLECLLRRSVGGTVIGRVKSVANSTTEETTKEHASRNTCSPTSCCGPDQATSCSST